MPALAAQLPQPLFFSQVRNGLTDGLKGFHFNGTIMKDDDFLESVVVELASLILRSALVRIWSILTGIRLPSLAVLMATFCAPFSFAGDVANGLIKQGFTAEMAGYHWQNPQEARVGRVFLSGHGMKLQKPDMFGTNKQGWTIQNFEQERTWVVQPERKIYALLPEADESNPETEQPVAGLMATEVCPSAQQADVKRITGSKMQLGKRVIGTRVINGFNTVVWECAYPWYSVKQFFSTELALVIREEYPSQHIAELRKIEMGQFGNDYFQPPAGWQEVSLEVFFLGAKSLETYIE